MHESHDIHCNDGERIFHYVQGTKHFMIHYAVSYPLELLGFTDFDWDGDSIEKNSTSAYIFILSHGPICC